MAQASQVQNLSPDFIKVSRMVPGMSNEQLENLRQTPYGFLASIEISKRNREMLMEEAKKRSPGENVFDSQLRMLRQRQLQEALSNDDRMGLNNLVAQAEGGGLEFGEPVEMAGGGMIAFESGGRVNQAGEKYYNDPELGRVYEDGSLGFAALGLVPLAARALSMYGPRILPKLGMEAGKRGIGALRAHPYITAGLGVASGVPFGLGVMGGDEEGLSPEELQKQYEAQDIQEGRPKPDRDVTGRGRGAGGAGGASARSGITGLDREVDPREILRLRRELEKEAGLGEFGAKAKEIREGRKGRVEKTIERALASEPYLAGAEAAGQVRPTGRRGLAGLLDVAAPTVAAMGKSAAGIQRQRTEALDKLAEGEERLALAEEQFLRGDIRDAAKESRDAKKDIFSSQIQLRQLDMLGKRLDAQVAAARARGSGFRYPTAEMAQLQREASEINAALAQGMIKPKQYQERMANWEQRRRQALEMSMLGNLQIGTRDRDTDED